jgi:hypothetical protein
LTTLAGNAKEGDMHHSLHAPSAVLVPVLIALSAARGADPVLVEGFRGEPEGGFRQSWYTHRGFEPLCGVRQRGPDLAIAWKSAPMPPDLGSRKVALVWMGAMGLASGGSGNFTVSVNGRPAADFDVAVRPVCFPGREEGAELLYEAGWAYCNRLDSSGRFYLIVPPSWVRPGEPAALEVRAKDTGSGAWFALMGDGDLPRALPAISRAPFDPRPRPAFPPPAGEEASYERYLPQYPDPGIYTPIGPPSDPAETAVTPEGHLVSAVERANVFGAEILPGTPFVRNSLVFALADGSEIVPFGTRGLARQSLEEGRLPIVTTKWRHGDFDVRETTFAEPLKGDSFETGKESSLAWASLEVTNRGPAARELTLLAASMGDEKAPKLDLAFRGGVLSLKGRPLLAVVSKPASFRVEHFPAFTAGGDAAPGADPLDLLRSGRGLLNALALRGEVPAGGTARIVLDRVFDFPGAWYWDSSPPAVAPEELTGRSFEEGLRKARAAWKALLDKVSRFSTPDPLLDRIAAKALLDGYFLTKRWDGRTIVFDSVPYRCQWDDASTKWFQALDLVGDHDMAERLLDTVFERQGRRKPAGTRTREGCFSDVTNTKADGSAAAWASCNGWALWAMVEHARLTGRRDWLDKHEAKILDGCRWILRERAFSKEKAGNPCAGLIHGKFVCDLPDEGQGGASGVGYFTYTDAISFVGLHGMARLLADWGHPEGKDLLREAELYRGDIIAAVDRLTDKSGDPWYVPWVLHAPKHVQRYLYDVCGPINLAFSCAGGGVVPRGDERIGHVIRWIIDRTHGGSLESAAAGESSPDQGAMFYSQDLALVLLELGRVEDFLRIFYALLAANVSHETLTACEWGRNTQPHIHSISSLVRMFRSMLIQERDGGLFLLQGVPRRWLEGGKEIAVRGAPTWYGNLSLRCVSEPGGKTISVHLSLPEGLGTAPVRLRLRMPGGARIGRVSVNGREHREVEDEWVVLRGLRGDVEVRADVR